MAFQYDEKTISAVDAEKNIRIKMSSKFYDISDRVFFVYRGSNLEFEFSVVQRKKKRAMVVGGKPTEELLAVASCILEPSIKKGVLKALHGQCPNQDVYNELKKDIAAGMFALSTWGGELLSDVPDYRVEFVQSFSEIE